MLRLAQNSSREVKKGLFRARARLTPSGSKDLQSTQELRVASVLSLRASAIPVGVPGRLKMVKMAQKDR